MSSALLLSGGMDSLCLAKWLRPVLGITVDYGQLGADAEIGASRSICEQFDIEHRVVQVNTASLGSGDMAGKAAHALAPASDWWPYRNQLLVTLGAMVAVERGLDTLLIGTVATDAQHCDGTEEFIDALDRLLALQEGAMRLLAPARSMTTVELIRTAGVTAGELAWAHSCHRSNVLCGECRGCNKYLAVLEEVRNELV